MELKGQVNRVDRVDGVDKGEYRILNIERRILNVEVKTLKVLLSALTYGLLACGL